MIDAVLVVFYAGTCGAWSALVTLAIYYAARTWAERRPT